MKFRHLVEKINIYLEDSTVYGISYYRIHFDVDLNDLYEKETQKNKHLIDKYFSNNDHRSGHKFVSYLISSKNNYDSVPHQPKLIRYKTFYDTYTSLTSFIIDLLESELKTIKFEVQNIDNLEEFKRLNDFFQKAELRWVYEYTKGVDYDSDVHQYEKLQLLSENSNNDFRKNRLNYYINDQTLDYPTVDIRSFVLSEKVPIKIEITEKEEIVWINAVEFKQKLKTYDNRSKPATFIDIPALFSRISQLERKFKQKNKRLILEQKRLEQVGLNPGDVIYTHEEVFIIKEISIQNSEVFCACYKLTQNIHISKKLEKVAIKNCIKYLPKHEFENLKEKFSWRYKALLLYYIKNNGKTVIQHK